MKASATITTNDVKEQVIISLFSGSFEERLVKTGKAGFNGIELLPLDPTALDVPQLVKIIHRKELQVAAIGTGIQASLGRLTLFSHDEDIAEAALYRMYRLIDFAESCETSIVTLGSFRGKIPYEDQEALDHFDSILANIAEYAARKSITLAIEPLNRYENTYLHKASEVIEVIDRIGLPNIGLLLDTFHMNIEEASMEKTISQSASHIVHVHIADNNRLPPGRGHIQFSAIIGSLREAEYDGWLSAELFVDPDPDTAGSETGAYLRSLIDQFSDKGSK